MKYCKKYDSLSEIPALDYQGYLWLSDESRPRSIRNKADIPVTKPTQFIVEGYLVSNDKKFSINLTSTNGKPTIYEFDLSAIGALPEDQKTTRSILTHRLDGFEKIDFLTVWQPEPDPQCNSMEVLKPAMRVCTGFQPKKNDL